MAEKEHMNLVIIGHVDHGKSTLTGRILLETGAIDPHIVEKYKKEAEEKGKGSFYFAWVMDGLKEERERGVTIDVAHKKFYTDKYYFTVIDAPGHRDFVKNMITGTSQADAAIITCSAIEGPQAQTKEHVFLATTLGVKQIIVAINKMDAVKYDHAKYDEAVAAMKKLFAMIGNKAENMPFIPVSAYMGDNIKTISANTPWYKYASYLNEDVNGFKGKKVSGDDSYLTAAISRDPLGVTVNYLSNIFDLESRKPGSELAILPLDLDKHGRQVLDAANLDNILNLLEEQQYAEIPVGSVGFSYDTTDRVINDFVSWVLTNVTGELHHYGLLTLPQNELTAQLQRIVNKELAQN